MEQINKREHVYICAEERGYRVMNGLASGNTYLTPLALLELAAWVEENREELESEGQIEAEGDRLYHESMAAEMSIIAREWQDYRNDGLGNAG